MARKRKFDNKLFLPLEWMDNPINVIVAGAGGTGGEMIAKLVRLHFGLIGTGHPYGLNVTVYDPKDVSHANIGRQNFLPVDIGQSKAILTIHRINLAYGLNWDAYNEPFQIERLDRNTDLLITCVDKAAVRADIGKFGKSYYCDDMLWLDTGNNEFQGSVILGHLGHDIDSCMRIPNCFDLYPELTDPALDEGDTPSCSLEEAIAVQDIPVNIMVADLAFALLWSLLRHGQIDRHGGFIDCKKLTSHPLLIDPTNWAMFGYKEKH